MNIEMIDNTLEPFIEWGQRRNKGIDKRNVIAMSKTIFKKVYDLFKDEEDIAFISIEYTPECAKGGEVVDNEHYAESSDRVLNLNFDDCSIRERYDGYWLTPIDYRQAQEIEYFVTKNVDKHIIIHCRAGKSRSQGVRRAIMNNLPEFYEDDPINDLNPCNTPNPEVVALISRVFRIMSAFGPIVCEK